MARINVFAEKKNGSDLDLSETQHLKKRVARSLKPMQKKYNVEVQ